jgi:hypothetical protein
MLGPRRGYTQDMGLSSCFWAGLGEEESAGNKGQDLLEKYLNLA